MMSMFCTPCQKYGKPPAQACGAWVTCPISNWVKATELLSKREKSEWHLASAEAQALAESARTHGGVIEQTVMASNEEKRKNRELMKKLIRSVYLVFRHRVPHTTAFEDVITLQVDNGNEQLRVHLSTCPGNAIYFFKFTS